MPEKESLRLAVCHMAVERGRLRENLEQALGLSRQAARAGAGIILHTEMALSGYGFSGRAELMPLALSAQSEALSPFGQLCRQHGCYLALGLAELEPASGLIYNSAHMWGPSGAICARRRKVTAEAKWSAAGPGAQPDCLCDTPWGRVGLAICSETYYSLVARGLALAGADLVLVPANWPPGGLDPCELWRLRALENGIFLAACNRGGKDEKFDCTRAVSAVFAPDGQYLANSNGPASQLVLADLPLQNGKLANGRRQRRLAGRRPGDYPYLAHDLRAVSDMTSFLDLPRPGPMQAWVACPPAEALRKPPALSAWLGQSGLPPGALLALPRLDRQCFSSMALGDLANRSGLMLAAALGKEAFVLARPQGRIDSFDLAAPLAGEPRLLDMEHFRLGVATAAELAHPEFAVVMAKRGCDLALVSAGPLPPEDMDCLAGRALDKLAVALATPGGGLLALPPQGHERWPEWKAAPGRVAGAMINSLGLRDKNFLERLDLKLLLAPATDRREQAA